MFRLGDPNAEVRKTLQLIAANKDAKTMLIAVAEQKLKEDMQSAIDSLTDLKKTPPSGFVIKILDIPQL